MLTLEDVLRGRSLSLPAFRTERNLLIPLFWIVIPLSCNQQRKWIDIVQWSWIGMLKCRITLTIDSNPEGWQRKWSLEGDCSFGPRRKVGVLTDCLFLPRHLCYGSFLLQSYWFYQKGWYLNPQIVTHSSASTFFFHSPSYENSICTVIVISFIANMNNTTTSFPALKWNWCTCTRHLYASLNK